MRITSAKTRQAILVQEGVVDPANPPEKLALFDENGNQIDYAGSHGIPAGGATGQVLGKVDDNDYSAEWVDPGAAVNGVPAGGATGQILSKVSDDDYDVTWVDAPVGGGGAAEGAMIWRGAWSPIADYLANDVVSYNPGSDPGAYIFNEDTPSGAPALVFDTHPLDGYITPESFPMDILLDATANKSTLVEQTGLPSPYRAYAIKVVTAGTHDLVVGPKIVGENRDTYGKLWLQQANGSWLLKAENDGSGTGGQPRITYAAAAGVYLFALSIYGGDKPAAYGTSVLTLGASNTAILGEWSAFPVDKVTRI